MKVLTISIAAYNVEDTIECALESLLVPEILPQIEILVCDDGGTDGTFDIAKRYEKEYPGVVRAIHKENGGYGSVLNTNIQLAQGKYFKQLDGDDQFVRENMCAFVELLAKTEADYVVTAMFENDRKQKKETFRDCCDYLKEDLYHFEQIQFQKAVNMHSSAYRTEILRAMPRKITEHCFYTDVELVVFPVPYLHKVYIWHQPVYRYNIGIDGQSISVAGTKRHYQDKYSVFWHLFGVYQEMDSDEVSRREYVRYWVVALAVSRFRSLFLFWPSTEHYQEIRDFYNELKEQCPDVLADAVSKVNAMKLFVYSDGTLYSLAVLLRLGKQKIRSIWAYLTAYFRKD